MKRPPSRPPVSDLLLQMWREVCRHLEIRTSADLVTGILREALPLAGLAVRRINITASMLETVAASSGIPGAAGTIAGRTLCSPAELRRILAWCAEGAVVHGRDPRFANELRALALPDLPGDVLVGPLGGEAGPIGIAFFFVSESERFSEADRAIVAAILEPLSVALENDRRLHELAVLREAAEADRGALLTRLGRRELSETIVGARGGLQPVLERVALVAASDVPILILGETGTGKEVIAREIHARSGRSGGPFFRVNCGAIPPGLIDSQLFGHEKGSFTGATDTRKGWFERADRGTLFLDEVGELPADAQVRLLRVLQDGSLERVGGQQSIPVDVRIVGATHRDLGTMVREGRFREDLWYRVAVFPLYLPALRERTEDIPALARYFAEKASTRFGLPPAIPTQEDLDILLRYAWPGNVRELAAVIDRALLLGDGRGLDIATALGGSFSRSAPAIGAAPLPAARMMVRDEPEEARPRGAPPSARQAPLAEIPVVALDDAMRQHIEEALRQAYGRVEGPFGAARRLCVNPNTLRARMRKLGISPREFRRKDPTPIA